MDYGQTKLTNLLDVRKLKDNDLPLHYRRKVSPILVTLASGSDSNFQRSNVILKENKPDGVNPNSNDIDHYVRKNERKILWLSAD